MTVNRPRSWSSSLRLNERLGISATHWNQMGSNGTLLMLGTWNGGMLEKWNDGQKRITAVFGSRVLGSGFLEKYRPELGIVFSIGWKIDPHSESRGSACQGYGDRTDSSLRRQIETQYSIIPLLRLRS